jgi:aspartate/methionine/tyrosine aminotransferase
MAGGCHGTPANGHDPRMRLADFALERYFARWEFAVRHVLCASDVEGFPMADLLAMADDETRALWDELRLGYTESTGHPLLRAEIAELYRHVEPDEVLVFAGAEEAIFCLLNVLVGPGDHAVVTWPGYQSLYEVARGAGADVTLHELHEADRWSIDVDRLIGELRPNTRVVVVNAPHNPTGMLPTHVEWARLTDELADRKIHLLSDEVYRFLERDEVDALLPGADTYAQGVSLGVMSKSFAMAGLRIGWLATRDRELLARCAAFKDYTTICSAAPSEILALIGLRSRDRVLARSLRIVADNLELLDDFFRRRSEWFSWVRPRAGSVGFPRLLADMPVDEFAAGLVEAEGVLLLPGSQFGHPGNHFRVGFGRENLAEALARLDAYAERVLS